MGYFLSNMRNEKGAVSVLVIFMMIILVALGAFAITSANVNYKFSKKAMEWDEAYYALDRLGEEYLMEVDKKLLLAENQAVEYLKAKGYEEISYQEIPEQMQRSIYEGFPMAANQSAGSKEEFLNQSLQRVYMVFAANRLEELGKEYEEHGLYPVMDHQDVSSLSTDIDLKIEQGHHLRISTHVLPILFSVKCSEESIEGTRLGGLRYSIQEWVQWQPRVENS